MNDVFKALGKYGRKPLYFIEFTLLYQIPGGRISSPENRDVYHNIPEFTS